MSATATPGAPSETRLIYIAGMARSGSTLLATMLAESPEVDALGEAHIPWTMIEIDPAWPCSCGDRAVECEVWGTVAGAETASRARMFGTWLRQAPSAQLRRVLRPRHARRIEAEWVGIMGSAYRTVAERLPGRAMVDSSKLPLLGRLSARAAPGPFSTVQLVRDPRAVAWSLARERSSWLGARVTAARAAINWLARNFAIASPGFRRAANLVAEVTYEELAERPREALNLLTTRLGIDPIELAGSPPRLELEPPSHLVAGNPSRHKRGPMPIRKSESWKAMPADMRIMVVALTLPGMLRWRYPLRLRDA